jgi:hypothetical protein
VGDITQQCADYGVATWGDYVCRTYCPAKGDKNLCYESYLVTENDSVSSDLICDMLAGS